MTGTYCSSVQEELVKLKEDTPSLFGVGLLVQVCVKVTQLWETEGKKLSDTTRTLLTPLIPKFSFKYFKEFSVGGLKLFLTTLSHLDGSGNLSLAALVISRKGKGEGGQEER